MGCSHLPYPQSPPAHAAGARSWRQTLQVAGQGAWRGLCHSCGPVGGLTVSLPQGREHPASTAIRFERLKYCLRREAKYLSMCLRVLSVCWAFVNTSTIWAPNSCAQNVGFPMQTGFPATNGAEGPPGRQWRSPGPYLGRSSPSSRLLHSSQRLSLPSGSLS